MESEFSYTITEIDRYYNESLFNSTRAFEELIAGLHFNPYRHFTEIDINGHNVSIHYIFWQHYCWDRTFNLTKEGNRIDIVPIVAKEPRPNCLPVGIVDPVEINLTLDKGVYTINFWNLGKHMDTATVEIGKKGKYVLSAEKRTG